MGYYCKFKDGQIKLPFYGLNVKSDIPTCFPVLTLKCLSVSPLQDELHVLHVYLHTTPDTKLIGKQSLNRKTFVSFLWLLKTIWILQQFDTPSKDFLNLVLVCKEVSTTMAELSLCLNCCYVKTFYDQLINNCFKTFVNR